MIRLAQRELNKQTPIRVKVDGIVGEQTLNALLFIEQIDNSWSMRRQIIGYIQYLAATEGINSGIIDGFYGPQTEYGYEQLKEKLSGKETKPWRDDEGKGSGKTIGGSQWPIQTQSELEKFYGPVGKNQVKTKIPYTMRLAWNKSQKVNHITCHEKVADSLVTVLEDVQKEYSASDIKSLGLDLFAGGLNIRKMRGGSKWSSHSWGIAFDFDSERNQLRWGKDKAQFAKPEYEKWWECWEKQGAVSLGRAKNYDFMHVQFCRVRK